MLGHYNNISIWLLWIIKKYCEGNTHPDVRKSYTRTDNVITDNISSFIIAYLKQDMEEKLSKQQHTAKRIYVRLIVENGYTGSCSAVREVVRNLRAEQLVPPQADNPL